MNFSKEQFEAIIARNTESVTNIMNMYPNIGEKPIETFHESIALQMLGRLSIESEVLTNLVQERGFMGDELDFDFEKGQVTTKYAKGLGKTLDELAEMKIKEQEKEQEETKSE